jgi:hypothetical protein
MSNFTDIKKHYKILTAIREDLIAIRTNFDEKSKEGHSLKYDIRRGGLSSKYKELQLVECTQSIEFIRIEFEKKHKEYEKLRKSIDPAKILDERYKEIKQKEFELLEKCGHDEKILKECEEKESLLEEVCKEYKIKDSLLNAGCLKRLNDLEKEIIIHRQYYELEKAANKKKKEEIHNEMSEFFQICEALEEEIELDEGILI